MCATSAAAFPYRVLDRPRQRRRLAIALCGIRTLLAPTKRSQMIHVFEARYDVLSCDIVHGLKEPVRLHTSLFEFELVFEASKPKEKTVKECDSDQDLRTKTMQWFTFQSTI